MARVVSSNECKSRLKADGVNVPLRKQFEHSLDQEDPLAARTIWLWTYEVSSTRTSWIHKVMSPPMSYEPRQYELDSTEIVYRKPERLEYGWNDVFWTSSTRSVA